MQRVTTYALTLVFKCRRCRQGDVVFTWQPTARTFSLEIRCSACRALHQLGVELVERALAAEQERVRRTP